ncbi:MAG: virulence RhuM family protein [Nanoarchaeota archaeon]|jgi:hypothetical protein|nr:virulence RhuM family protein [Nanoarchaeota archaeon]
MEEKFLIYKSSAEDVNINVVYRDETIWATQKVLAELFGVDRTVVTKHLKSIFEGGELNENSVCAKNAHTAEDGKKYMVNYYNLDAIISVGYRVSSEKATKFRIWATSVLKDYMVKGYVLDKNRLSNGKHFGKDYFDELVENIREIRASERRFYQKITDIYATAADYDSNSEVTRKFFSVVQNKLHFAVHGKTASELIVDRADSGEVNMGLFSWKNSPKGKVSPSDVLVAKNYLNEEELNELNRIVNMYLDYAEDRAKKQIIMTMEDWVLKLNAFLEFNERDVLENAGDVSSEIAKRFAEGEFDRYRVLQDEVYESDFDLVLKESLSEYSGK